MHKNHKEECLELKNIKYQTMLLNNNTKIYMKPRLIQIILKNF